MAYPRQFPPQTPQIYASENYIAPPFMSERSSTMRVNGRRNSSICAEFVEGFDWPESRIRKGEPRGSDETTYT